MNNKKEIDITIKYIAEQLGVSFSTVAKALNDDPVVKEETRKRVQDKAAELGYYPNILAKGLRSKVSKTIGIILNDIENPTRSHIVKRISVDLAKYGYTTLIFDSQYDLDIEKRNILNVLSRMPDCVVISPVSKDIVNLSLLNNIFDRTVILSMMFDNIPANYVHMDHKHGGYISASAMLNYGHTRNIIFVEPIDFPSSVQFLDGVKLAYKEKDVPFDEDLVIYRIPSIENGCDAICSLYDSKKKGFTIPFTGVIANYDMYAFGVYKAAIKLGFKIPGDISVIGYDDNPMASMLTPPLTTMFMPSESVAAHCSAILLSKLVDKDPTIKSYDLKPYLVERDSIKRNM